MRLEEKLAVASSRSQEMAVGTAAAEPDGLEAWVEPAAGEATGPVSYTHLDVYKRQGQ